jgi:hypothetical protein
MSAEVKPNCLGCVHCGPKVGNTIRCDHPIWAETNDGDDDLEMRTFDPEFGEICSDFQKATEGGSVS